VLETACAQAVEWIESHGPIRITVNVTARQLADPTFAGTVDSIVTSTGLDPKQLTLELTESVLMTGDRVGAVNLDDLRGLGLRVAVDDFGTGYSSLAYLAKLSIDTIKIDRSFVDACDQTVEGARIVEAITTLGHALNIAVVAEGIERSSQLDVLRSVGCDAVQGFLLARPAPAEELRDLLANPRPLPFS
jgi:EAL domain-containing protein (putative c-di-GMP-specific phosphodiesterase class I)